MGFEFKADRSNRLLYSKVSGGFTFEELCDLVYDALSHPDLQHGGRIVVDLREAIAEVRGRQISGNAGEIPEGLSSGSRYRCGILALGEQEYFLSMLFTLRLDASVHDPVEFAVFRRPREICKWLDLEESELLEIVSSE